MIIDQETGVLLVRDYDLNKSFTNKKMPDNFTQYKIEFKGMMRRLYSIQWGMKSRLYINVSGEQLTVKIIR